MVMETFLGKTVRWELPNLSRGPGTMTVDEYYRHLHRYDADSQRMMDKVIPDRILRDNMKHIVGMR